MIDNNVVAFYCSNCHKTVWNYEHNFEQLHKKGLCAECLKKQNKPTISKMESVDNYLCKWQKLKEWLKLQIDGLNEQLCDYDFDSDCREISMENFEIMLQQMQELEVEDVKD